MEGSSAGIPSGGGDASASSASVPSSFGGNSGGSGSAAPANDNAAKAPANDNARAQPQGPDGAPAQPEKPKWYREKHKLNRGGQEREVTIEDALSMLGDDYEEEVTVSGEQRKVKRAELMRGYQKSGGAEQLMRKAAEQRQNLEQQIAYGKENPHWVLENVLGVGDHEEWAMNVVRQRIAREKELAELYERDPLAHSDKMMRLAEERFNRKQAFEQSQRTRADQQRAMQEGNRERDAKAQAAAKAVGLPITRHTETLVRQVLAKYQELGYEVPIEDAVHEAKQEYVKEVFGFIDGHDDDRLLELLGNDRRKRFRELELRKVGNGSAQQQQRPKPEGDGAPRSNSNKVREISEAEFMKSTRRS